MAKGKALMSMAEIEKQMSVFADSDRQRLIQTGGNMIGTRNERFTFKGSAIGREFRCTVVGFVHQNAFYEEAFDPENISVPGCFALSFDGVEMAPPDNVPNRQNPQCDGCPQNVFGSAEIGRGKRCKNQYRLAVIPEDCRDAREGDIAFLTLPPTSIKPWNDYVQSVSALHGLPVWGVSTEFYFEEGPAEAISGILTGRIHKIGKNKGIHKDPVLLGSIIATQDMHRAQLLEGPDVSQYEPPKKGRKSKAKTKAKRKVAPKSKAKRKAKSRTNRSKFK